MTLVYQELLAVSEFPSSLPLFSGVHVALKSLFFCVVFCGWTTVCLSVLFFCWSLYSQPFDLWLLIIVSSIS